ncbi:FMN-binding protein [Paenibacillus albus]|uniref:FMN-binding protein n=1 Tax=Paenibacillus albus TaxID=2495582 RepID=A0A3S9A710_9BACL|nr:FMN-binding protein [Paenibacillus albus]AZN41557.1 FMN-binding protein [Paenibacillus albus]
MAKMNKKWVVLCSTAIAAVYVAGYWTTEIDKTNVLINTDYSSPSVSSSTLEGDSPQVSDSQSQVSTKYNNGTYIGMGSNRRGTIQVTVAIKNDRITDVEISDFAMHYSIDDVIGMPEEVLKIQSANVDNVSGATYSTRAFSDAIQDALNQALRA